MSIINLPTSKILSVFITLIIVGTFGGKIIESARLNYFRTGHIELIYSTCGIGGESFYKLFLISECTPLISEAYFYEICTKDERNKLDLNVVHLLVCRLINNGEENITDELFWSKYNLAYASYRIAIQYDNNNNWEKALKYYKIFLKHGNSTDDLALVKTFHRVGQIYLDHLKDQEKSIPYFQKTVRLSPKNSYYRVKLAQAYLRNDNVWDAILELEVSLDIKKDNYLAYYYLGESYNKLGLHNKAIKNYRLSISQKSTFSWSRYSLAKLYNKLGKENKAIYQLKKILEFNPSFAPAQEILENVGE